MARVVGRSVGQVLRVGGVLALALHAPGKTAWGASSETTRNLAVLEVVPRGGLATDAAAREYARLLADGVRQGAVEATSAHPYSVMTRDTIQAALESAGACGDESGECVLAMGASVRADAVLGCDLYALEGRLYLKLELYDVAQGRLLEMRRLDAASQSDLLARTPGEAGAMVRKGLALRTFGGGLDLQVPVVRTAPQGRLGLSSFNADAEQGFQAASRAQGNAKATPEEKQAAWCKLASFTENNRYLETAREACQSWSRYVDAIRALRRTLPEDYEKIVVVLDFPHIAADEKRALVEEFVETYRVLGDDPRVRNVVEAKEGLARGQRATVLAPDEIERVEASRQRRAREAERERDARRRAAVVAREMAGRTRVAEARNLAAQGVGALGWAGLAGSALVALPLVALSGLYLSLFVPGVQDVTWAAVRVNRLTRMTWSTVYLWHYQRNLVCWLGSCVGLNFVLPWALPLALATVDAVVWVAVGGILAFLGRSDDAVATALAWASPAVPCLIPVSLARLVGAGGEATAELEGAP
jgi:hypothetical protein